MSTAYDIEGQLNFINLGELLQLLGSMGSNGILVLTSKHAPHPGSIFLRQGNPVHASTVDVEGLDAFYALFGWTEGEFNFRKDGAECPQTIKANRMQLILDGLRMLDDGRIQKIGPLADIGDGSQAIKSNARLPVIKGPLVDYMYVVDEEEYNEGEEIVIEGKYGSWMWVVLEGTAEVAKTSASGLTQILRIGDGSFVGSIASFISGGNVRSATTTAVSKIHLGMLDSQQLSNEFSQMSPELREILRSLDMRLKSVTNRIVDIQAGKINPSQFLHTRKPVIAQQADENRLFKIVKGKASLVRHTAKGLIPLANLYRDDFFGNMPFLDIGHEPVSAAVYAAKNLKVVKLDIDKLQQEYDQLSNTLKNIIENVATCVSATTMMAVEHFRQFAAKREKSR